MPVSNPLVGNPLVGNPLTDPFPASAATGYGNILGNIRGQLAANPATAPTGFAAQLGRTPLLRGAVERGPGAAGALAPGSLGRGLGYGIAGQLGSGLIRGVIGGEKDGNWDDFAADAAAYGGAGAGIGSMIAPGVGTAIGGALGVGASAVKNFVLGGGSDSDSTETAREVATQEKILAGLLRNLSPEAAQQIRLELQTANAGVTDRATIVANYTAIRTAIPQLAAQEQQQRQQLTGLLAAQQMLAPQFDGFLQNIGADSKAFSAASNEYADQLGTMNPAFAGYMKSNNARSVLSDSATAAAYKSQMGATTAQMASNIAAPQSITDSLMAQYG